jgi:hypothetical protein
MVGMPPLNLLPRGKLQWRVLYGRSYHERHASFPGTSLNASSAGKSRLPTMLGHGDDLPVTDCSNNDDVLIEFVL